MKKKLTQEQELILVRGYKAEAFKLGDEADLKELKERRLIIECGRQAPCRTFDEVLPEATVYKLTKKGINYVRNNLQKDVSSGNNRSL